MDGEEVEYLYDNTECDTENDAPLIIGTGWKGLRQFAGVIDNLRIYNRAVSEDEIQLLSKEK